MNGKAEDAGLEQTAEDLRYAHDTLAQIELQCEQLKNNMRRGQIKYLPTNNELAVKYGNQVFGLEQICGRIKLLKTMATRDQLRVLGNHTVMGRTKKRPVTGTTSVETSRP